MAGFERENFSLNSPLNQINNQSLELINSDSSSVSSPFILFSNGVLFDGHHQSRSSFGFSLHGDVGEKDKSGESGCKRRSKRKKDEKVMDSVEKAREDVVHVRAKRGQATDSHSLAERVRREKINERLRSLQDLVPGCYKTMGMAVMLDVIINYVRSLQNQIEFLSMKLSAASAYYDLNSLDIEPMEILQGGGIYSAEEMERIIREVHEAQPPNFSSTWPF